MNAGLKVATLTMNPAVDQMVFVPGFRSGQVNRVERSESRAGGKGVNVATALADLGFETVAAGFLGTENAALFERHFARKHITDRFVRVPGSTRIGIKILGDGETTDLNFPGLAPAAEHFEALFASVEEIAGDCAWFVLSGSLPPGAPPDVYRALIEALHAKGCAVALDTSGEAFRLALPAAPDLVKPNVHELSEHVGRKLGNAHEAALAARGLLDQGIRRVVVSMGEEGAIFTDGETVVQALPPQVRVLGTVGAGDAMVAGIVAGLARGLPLAGCARLATALAAAAVSQTESGVQSAERLEALEKQVVLSGAFT